MITRHVRCVDRHSRARPVEHREHLTSTIWLSWAKHIYAGLVHRAIQHGGCIISAPVLGGLHHHYCKI